MRVFDYNSFADLSLVFDLRKGQIVPPQPLVSADAIMAEPKARVILYSTTSLKAQLAQSKFVSLGTLLPTAKPRFLTASAKKIKPVVVEIAPVVAVPAATTVAAPKVRKTLKLKTKIELPTLQPLSRRSTTQDLANAFKAEMALMEKMEKKAVVEPAGKLEDAFTKRRRHPLSNKPWSELLAEVEAPKSKNNFDLAAAFKNEMKAFMAEQERMGNAAALQFKPVAEQQKPANTQQVPVRRLAA